MVSFLKDESFFTVVGVDFHLQSVLYKLTEPKHFAKLIIKAFHRSYLERCSFPLNWITASVLTFRDFVGCYQQTDLVEILLAL